MFSHLVAKGELLSVFWGMARVNRRFNRHPIIMRLTGMACQAHNGDMGIAKLLVIPAAERWAEIGRLLCAPVFGLGSERRVLDLLHSLGVEKL